MAGVQIWKPPPHDAYDTLQVAFFFKQADRGGFPAVRFL